MGLKVQGPRRDHTIMLSSIQSVLRATFKKLDKSHTILNTLQGLEISERLWIAVKRGPLPMEDAIPSKGAMALSILVEEIECDYFQITATCASCNKKHEMGRFISTRHAAYEVCNILSSQEVKSTIQNLPFTQEERADLESMTDTDMDVEFTTKTDNIPLSIFNMNSSSYEQ